MMKTKLSLKCDVEKKKLCRNPKTRSTKKNPGQQSKRKRLTGSESPETVVYLNGYKRIEKLNKTLKLWHNSFV